MKSPGWRIAIVACLRDRQFWRDTGAEAVGIVANPSTGFAVAVAAVILRIGHRIFAGSSLQEIAGSSRKA
mgnify:CR=1 FL=1